MSCWAQLNYSATRVYYCNNCSPSSLLVCVIANGAWFGWVPVRIRIRIGLRLGWVRFGLDWSGNGNGADVSLVAEVTVDR